MQYFSFIDLQWKKFEFTIYELINELNHDYIITLDAVILR